MNENYNLERCPDCGRKQKLPKKLSDGCDNEFCESYISKIEKLVWDNPNWG